MFPLGSEAETEWPFPCRGRGEREFFIDNLLVRNHFITVIIRWTGLALWEVEFPFPGSLTYSFLAGGAGTSLDPPEAKPFQFAGGEIELSRRPLFMQGVSE